MQQLGEQMDAPQNDADSDADSSPDQKSGEGFERRDADVKEEVAASQPRAERLGYGRRLAHEELGDNDTG